MAWLHPEFLWTFAAVPLAILLFVYAWWRRGVLRRRFGDDTLVRRLTALVNGRRRRWKSALMVAGIAFLCLALAGPKVGTKLKEVKREGVDIVIALDVSLSMEAEDVAPNRLNRAKNELKKLLSALRGDRVGLVIFAGDAFLQCPLTTDYSALRLFLDVASRDLLPTPGTDFEKALNEAVRALEGASNDVEAEDRSRAVMIVSDGENHVPNLDAILRRAREANVVIYTVGVGETSGTPIPVYEGGRRRFHRDLAGEIVQTKLEEEELKRLAKDGAYFRIARTSSSVMQVIPALERLERTEFATEQFEEYAVKYQIPLVLALVLLMVEGLFSARKKPNLQ